MSRLHAYIKHINKKFVILDNNSKFGTLILMRKGFEIEKRKIALQLGRTVVTFSLKQQQLNGMTAGNPLKNPLLNEKDKGSQMQQEDAQDDIYGIKDSNTNAQGANAGSNNDNYYNLNAGMQSNMNSGHPFNNIAGNQPPANPTNQNSKFY